MQNKLNYLKSKIINSILPLVTNNYVLWDLPYHNNIGDLLIWEGEISFLKAIPYYNCVNYSSIETCEYPKLSEETIILLHGGGNFGDIWEKHQDFRLKVIKMYPKNRIIILPQTVYYSDNCKLMHDISVMKQHNDLHVCTRDHQSYTLLKEHINNTMLLPDMAFCIDCGILQKYMLNCQDKALFVKRKDLELNTNTNYHIETEYPFDIKDWPSFEKEGPLNITRRILHKLTINYPIYPLLQFYNSFMNYYKYKMIKKGIQFVSSYKEVYTTRLHVAILRVLLEQPFFLYDNNYGKNSSFYETWLKNIDNTSCICNKSN